MFVGPPALNVPCGCLCIPAFALVSVRLLCLDFPACAPVLVFDKLWALVLESVRECRPRLQTPTSAGLPASQTLAWFGAKWKNNIAYPSE